VAREGDRGTEMKGGGGGGGGENPILGKSQMN